MERTFEIKEAVREKVPLFVGMVGAPGSGKTYSALRVGTGMLRVTGGKLGLIDTESGRGLHYAPNPGQKADPSKGTFDFEYLKFGAPFASEDYHTAIMALKAKGCSVVVVDSMTHEHTGQGGVLEQYEKAVPMLMEKWGTKSEGAVGPSAWRVAKAGRKRLVNDLTQLSDPIVIFCFRAKEGVDFKKKGEEMDLGWEPEGGKEIFYEMMLTCLLPPRSKGVPVWTSKKKGEDFSIKLPGQFAPIFADNRSLDEKHGEALAMWAKGGESAAPVNQVSPADPKPKPAEETPSQRSVKLIGWLNESVSVEQLEKRWDTVNKKEGQQVADLCADTYAAKLDSLKQAA